MTARSTQNSPSTRIAEPPSAAGTVRRRLLAGGMVLTAGALLAGHLLNVPATLPTREFLAQVEAGPSSFLIGGLVQAASAFLLIPCAIGILALVPARGAAVASVGTILTGLGAAATGAGLVMITTMMAMLDGTDRALAGRVYGLAGHSSIGGLPFLLAPAMLIGLLLLGVALLRARTVHPAAAVVLIVGAVLAGVAPGGGALGAVGHLPLAVALVALAIRLGLRSRSPER